ncbi:MAG: DUF1573 domain-containing protein [Planctomycetes bacterium]|nr:DUF1573 domain-containing protein [Planctomycetota bacterium]
MGRFLPVCCLTIILAGCERQEQARPRSSPGVGLAAINAGPLTIEPGGFDFGVIDPKSIHQALITLRNNGADPIRIIDAKPDCRCTAPENLAGRVIGPGESIPFSSTFTAPTETGPKKAKITLIFQHGGKTQRTISIPLYGLITMAVRAAPTYVDALKGVTSGQVRLDSVDGRPFRIISADGRPPVFADGFEPASGQPRNAYTVQWHVPPRSIDDCAGARLWWVVETDHPDCPILPLRIRHECTGIRGDPDRRERGWSFKEYIANLGAVAGGKSIEVDVEIDNKTLVPILSVESMSPDARAELVSTQPRSGGLTGGVTRCRVRFTPRQGYEGMLYALVLFRSGTGDKEIAFISRVLDQ